MPYKEREIEKLYYTMGEVSQLFDVNASQIRYYEREFEILQPKKNKKGNRLFSPEDVENLKIIFSLVKDKGFTLQGAKDILKSEPATPIATAIIPSNKSKESAETLKSLLLIRSFLVEIQQQL